MIVSVSNPVHLIHYMVQIRIPKSKKCTVGHVIDVSIDTLLDAEN